MSWTIQISRSHQFQFALLMSSPVPAQNQSKFACVSPRFAEKSTASQPPAVPRTKAFAENEVARITLPLEICANCVSVTKLRKSPCICPRASCNVLISVQFPRRGNYITSQVSSSNIGKYLLEKLRVASIVVRMAPWKRNYGKTGTINFTDYKTFTLFNFTIATWNLPVNLPNRHFELLFVLSRRLARSDIWENSHGIWS